MTQSFIGLHWHRQVGNEDNNVSWRMLVQPELLRHGVLSSDRTQCRYVRLTSRPSRTGCALNWTECWANDAVAPLSIAVLLSVAVFQIIIMRENKPLLDLPPPGPTNSTSHIQSYDSVAGAYTDGNLQRLSGENEPSQLASAPLIGQSKQASRY